MLGRWDPFSEMSRLQDEVFGRGSRMGQFSPAVDIYEEKNAIVLTAELPGVKPEEIHVSVDKGVLTIRGERKMESEDKQEGYHRVERSYGSFTRSFVLPDTVDAEHIEASCDAGVLSLRLPKKPAAQPRRISVRGAQSMGAGATEGETVQAQGQQGQQQTQGKQVAVKNGQGEQQQQRR